MTDLSELQPLMHPKIEHPVLNSLAGRINGHTNKLVGTLIQDVCAEAARELMTGSSMTLSEIAAKVGFETVHSLSRAFRSEEGLAPSQYRRCSVVHTRVEGRATPYST